jgi:hypothetical protein
MTENDRCKPSTIFILMETLRGALRQVGASGNLPHRKRDQSVIYGGRRTGGSNL